MGMFFAAAALVAALGHLMIEDWVTPDPAEWAAIFGLGAFPMGLALYFWDHGVKRGDIQALGAISYFEPFLGALFVILVGQGTFHFSILWAGVLVIGGAALASRSVWEWTGTEEPAAPAPIPSLLPQLDLGAPFTVDVLRRISMVVKP
jgi:drug/metabolite transporter (DMT)-like permease